MATNWKAITLINFSDDQLIFSEEETRSVLIFFFPSQEEKIRALEITNRYRNFAQGLMVAAVDASYTIGWIEIVTEGYCKPAGSVKGALSKLGREGAKHWFKNAKKENLINAKIAEGVRKEISWQFGRFFEAMWQTNAVPFLRTIYINLAICKTRGQVFWG